MSRNLDISQKSINSSAFPLENLELEEFGHTRTEEVKTCENTDKKGAPGLKAEVVNDEHQMDISEEENNEDETDAAPQSGSGSWIDITGETAENNPKSEDFTAEYKYDDVDRKSDDCDLIGKRTPEKSINSTDNGSTIRERISNSDEINTTSTKEMDNGNNPGGANGNNPGGANNAGGKGKKVLKEIGLFALKSAVISGAILGGTALIVPALGFGTLGVTSGSLAAACQSSVLDVSGSAFATLQSIGTAAAASGVNSLYKKIKKKD